MMTMSPVTAMPQAAARSKDKPKTINRMNTPTAKMALTLGR